MLKAVFEMNADLKRKSKNFEMARLVDELFVAGKIKKDLYENLNRYRKKRNEVVHRALKYKDKKQFDKELKEVYKLGRGMKGFIIDEMVKTLKGRTLAELSAQTQHDLGKVMSEIPKAIDREITPILRKVAKDLRKLNKKQSEDHLGPDASFPNAE